MTAIVKKAADSGRMLRDVAIEEGVDAELYDRVIDLRRIAQGSAAQGVNGGNARATAKRQRASGGRVGEEALLLIPRRRRERGSSRRIEPPAKVGRSAKSCRFQTSMPVSRGSAR